MNLKNEFSKAPFAHQIQCINKHVDRYCVYDMHIRIYSKWCNAKLHVQRIIQLFMNAPIIKYDWRTTESTGGTRKLHSSRFSHDEWVNFSIFLETMFALYLFSLSRHTRSQWDYLFSHSSRFNHALLFTSDFNQTNKHLLEVLNLRVVK